MRVIRLNAVTAAAAASGLKCLSHLLISKGRVNWSDVSQLYGVILGFITDSRPKVNFLFHPFRLSNHIFCCLYFNFKLFWLSKTKFQFSSC